MKKRVVSLLLVVTIVMTSIMGNVQRTYADDKAFDYTMLSLSNEEPLIINAKGGNLSGNIASNCGIEVGSINRNCKMYDNIAADLPILFDAIYEEYFDPLVNENLNLDIKNTSNLNISEGLRAVTDINVHSNCINGNNAIIVSEAGSITIEADNMSLSGFIYAPYGKVTLIGNNVNLNGICIIADTININAGNANISANQTVMKWIGENAVYDEIEKFVYAIGECVDNTISIRWDTNCIGSAKIYESDDNINYTHIATVDNNGYTYTINEAFEVKYIIVTVKGLSSIPFVITKIENGYETGLLDSDSDGLADLFEEIYETDKYSVDTDNDKLSDYDEIVFTHTNTIIYDSVNQGKADGDIDLDSDGLDNKSEIVVATNPLEYDTDGDKLGDYDELYKYNTNPVNADTDLDGLYDGSELRFLTDPLNPDSNNNGIKDGDETYEQDLMDECYEDSIMVENIAIPSITVVQNGDASVNTICSEYAGHLKGDGHEFVGKCIEVTGSAALSGKISFKLDNTYVLPEYKFGDYNTNGLLICVNKDETTIPLETTYDVTTRTLSADFVDDGIYFVMDAVYWFDSLGIDASDVVEDLENEYINATESVNTFSMRNSEQTKGVPYADENKEVSIAGKQVSSQVDIVFIVDTTGSMSSYITNVKNNINSFVDTLTSANIKPYFALVEYRDITCDGKHSTNAKINPLNNTCWFNTAESFKMQIASLKVSGGGDIPETTIDGLEFARRLNMRESSDKFFIVVTDAGFKVDNNYNINSMDEMISLLVEGNINTSVITNSNYKNEYSNLYTTTGGIYANVGGNFKEELISIANRIIENTNDGSWIVLNGLTPQIVKLKEKPMYGSRVDSDSDCLTDVEELGTLVPVKKFNAARYMYTLIPTLMPVGSEKWDMYVYNYKSNPVKADTDGDSLLDGQAIEIKFENETIDVAPKDDNPKVYSGQKGLWKEHIKSLESKDKLATQDGDKYYSDIKAPWEDGFWHFVNSLYASAESVACDFRYDNKNIAIHSYGFQWQIVGGYNNFYDWAFDVVCSMDKRKLDFEYNGTNYAIWAWKGTYLSLGAGSEVGFYENNNPIGLWEASDRLKMSCSLYHKTNDGYSTIYNWYPKDRQWWTTGFQPDEYGWNQDELGQIASVKFDDPDMYDAFKGFYNVSDERKNIVFDDEENRVWLVW